MTGEQFNKIRVRAGFTAAEFTEYLLSKHSVQRSNTYIYKLEARELVPARWVGYLREMIGEKVYKVILKEMELEQ